MTAAQLICFTGSGGTGKTTVLNQLAKFDEITVFPSIVRKFYASSGMTDEKAFQTLHPEQKVKFQKALITHYMMSLEGAIHDCKTDILVADRSITDHIAYAIVSGTGVMTQRDLDDLYGLYSRFLKLKPSPRLVYFPYPASWMRNGSTEDGFRHVDPIKDTMIDALVYKLVTNDAHRLCADARMTQIMRNENLYTRVSTILTSLCGIVAYGDKLDGISSLTPTAPTPRPSASNS